MTDRVSASAACLLAASLATLIAQSGTSATRRVPQFENQHVTVWKSIVLPKQPLTMHRHEHGRTIVALKGGTLKIVEKSGETHSVVWETGKAYWLDADPPGAQHADVNEGPEPIEIMVVEMKR
jgi:hypothetical protein